MNGKFGVILFGAATLALAGCSAAPAESGADGQAQAPLKVIQLSEGHSVEFYRVGDAIVVSEVGKLGTPSVIEAKGLKGAAPAKIFAALAPNEPILPELLAESVGDVPAGEVAAEASSSEAKSFSGDVAQVKQAVTSSDFLASGVCNYTFTQLVFKDCRTNWSNGYFAYATAKNSYFSVASASGAFQVELRQNGGTPFIYPVVNNQWRTISSIWGGSGVVQHRWDITQASGNTFHVSDYFYNGNYVP